MNKKKLLLIIISAVLLITACVSIGISGVLSPYERQVRLGYKLLEQGKYEEAILAFDKAIEIDVKRDKAYIGKADVYVARCDENTLEDIKAVMETAYNQHYSDKNIVDAFIRLADDLCNKDKLEWAIELLNYGYELTGDERINEHRAELRDKFAADFLKTLYEMFESGNTDAVKQEIQSEKYLAFMNLVEDKDYKYIYFPTSNKDKTGKGVALYYVETENFGNVFVYYGDYVNGARSGNGTWVGADGIQYYWFEGTWNNDKPNGAGTISTVRDEARIKKEGNTTYCLKLEVVGSFKDGLYHGTINEKWTMDDGDVMKWHPINSTDGIYHGVDVPDMFDYADERLAAGDYLVSMTDEGSDLWDDGTVHAIKGFEK